MTVAPGKADDVGQSMGARRSLHRGSQCDTQPQVRRSAHSWADCWCAGQQDPGSCQLGSGFTNTQRQLCLKNDGGRAWADASVKKRSLDQLPVKKSHQACVTKQGPTAPPLAKEAHIWQKKNVRTTTTPKEAAFRITYWKCFTHKSLSY